MSSFSNAKATHFFPAKNINVFATFQYRNFNVTLAKNFVKFWTNGPWSYEFYNEWSFVFRVNTYSIYFCNIYEVMHLFIFQENVLASIFEPQYGGIEVHRRLWSVFPSEQSHRAFNSLSTYYTVSSVSVEIQWRSWPDCANTQDDLVLLYQYVRFKGPFLALWLILSFI